MKREIARSYKEAEEYFKNENNVRELLCLSHNNTFLLTSSLKKAKKFYIENGEEPVECKKKLFIEFSGDHIFTPEEQPYVQESKNRVATEKEIEEAKEYYKKNYKCKYHLFYDEPTWIYYMRVCGICGCQIALI